MKSKYKNQNNQTTYDTPKNSNVIGWSFIIGSIFLGFSFFVWTLYPYYQMTVFVKNLEKSLAGNATDLFNSKFSFEPYTHVQPAIRYMFISHMFSEYKDGNLNASFAPLIKLAIDKMDETVTRTDDYPHYIGLIGKSYDSLADLTPENSTEYHLIAEKYYKKAINLSPGNYNQDAKFAYAINLTNQNRASEALSLMRETVAYDSRPPEPHYFLSLALFKSGEAYWEESLTEMEYSFNNGFDPGQGLAKKIYEKFLLYFYNKNDIKNLLIVVNRLAILDPEQHDTYIEIIDFIKIHNYAPNFNLSN